MKIIKSDLKMIRKYCKLRNLPKKSSRRAFEQASEAVRIEYRKEMNDYFEMVKKSKSGGKSSK